MISKLSCYKGSWSGESEIILEELQSRGVFSNGFTGKNNANPYWYGTILNFDVLEKQCPFLKKERVERIVETYKNNGISPIVTLLGLTLERKLLNKKHDERR